MNTEQESIPPNPNDIIQGSSADNYGTDEQAKAIDRSTLGEPPPVIFTAAPVPEPPRPDRVRLSKRMLDALIGYPDCSDQWYAYERANQWMEFKKRYPRWLRWLMRFWE